MTAQTPDTASAQAAPAAAAAARAQEDAQAQERAAAEEAQRAAQQAQLEDLLNQRGGRRRPRGGRGSSFPAGDASIPAAMSGFSSSRTQAGAEGPPPPDAALPNEPKALVSLNLWVLTIELPRAKAADDLVGRLAASINELPTELGSRDDVRVLIGKLSVAGLLKRSREFHMISVNGQTAGTVVGASKPTISSTQSSVRGGRANSITYQLVGTNVQLSPRVFANGNLQVAVMYESSDVQKSSPPVLLGDLGDGAEPVIADQVVNQRINTSVQLKKGSAVLVQRDILTEPNNEAATITTQLVILAASVIPPLE
ncbi:MAG: hypothetical protein WD669_02260 [Pirellulales bacterium]